MLIRKQGNNWRSRNLVALVIGFLSCHFSLAIANWQVCSGEFFGEEPDFESIIEKIRVFQDAFIREDNEKSWKEAEDANSL